MERRVFILAETQAPFLVHKSPFMHIQKFQLMVSKLTKLSKLPG